MGKTIHHDLINIEQAQVLVAKANNLFSGQRVQVASVSIDTDGNEHHFETREGVFKGARVKLYPNYPNQRPDVVITAARWPHFAKIGENDRLIIGENDVTMEITGVSGRRAIHKFTLIR